VLVKGRVGKITAFDGSTGEYLVMLGSKNERCSESEIERLKEGSKKTLKKDMTRTKKPKGKGQVWAG
jgi:hypothetical protein